MKRRTASAISNSRYGKKAEVRKWMLYYDRQETFEHASRTKYKLAHAWLTGDNRDKVRRLVHIEGLLTKVAKYA
jgi:hypothetical protein